MKVRIGRTAAAAAMGAAVFAAGGAWAEEVRAGRAVEISVEAATVEIVVERGKEIMKIVADAKGRVAGIANEQVPGGLAQRLSVEIPATVETEVVKAAEGGGRVIARAQRWGFSDDAAKARADRARRAASEARAAATEARAGGEARAATGSSAGLAAALEAAAEDAEAEAARAAEAKLTTRVEVLLRTPEPAPPAPAKEPSFGGFETWRLAAAAAGGMALQAVGIALAFGFSGRRRKDEPAERKTPTLAAGTPPDAGAGG